MMATNFRGCTDGPKEVRTQLNVRWSPYEQIPWGRSTPVPEAAAIVQTKRLTGRWISSVRETLLHLPERCFVLPTWHDAPTAVGGIQEHPATTVEDGARPSYINLIAFHGQ